MTPASASLIATALAFLFAAVFAVWHVVPWMRQRPAAVAITACLWVHVGRIVALQIYSAPLRLRDAACGGPAGPVG